MLKTIFVLLLNLFLVSSAVADGKILIGSNVKDAYVFIDGKKKAMIGDGSTTITVSEGEHKVRVYKKTEHDEYEGERTIFVGDNTTIDLFIKLTTAHLLEFGR